MSNYEAPEDIEPAELLSAEEETDEARAPRPGVPSIDDEKPGKVDYLDYDAAKTKVVSGPLGAKQFPGRRFASRRDARRYWLQRAGKIIEEHSVNGRYVFRVRKDA